ncbi:hypothetical protein BGX24_010258 [Mortierella sp. AD032]|nr:hypothetical protein BGX24_010258 [Mortierella sp. AD032]
MTPQEKSCHCGAANSDAWIQSCAKPDLCNNLALNILRSAYGPIKMACDAAGISVSGAAGISASGAGGALTPKTAVTGVAVIAAALGVLL